MTRRAPKSPPTGGAASSAFLAGAAAVAVLAAAAVWWWLGRPVSPANPAVERLAQHSEPAVEAPRIETPPSASSARSADVAPAAPPAQEGTSGPATAPASDGFVRIEVLDATASPLADVPVTLVRPQSDSRAERTDATGLASFRGLAHGDWSARVGGVEHPLVPPREVEALANAGELIQVRLPELAELEVEVVDEAGRPAPNVAVRARCDAGGEPQATTGLDGRAVLRFVALGHARVHANDPVLGRGNRALIVERGERAVVQIALRTKP